MLASPDHFSGCGEGLIVIGDADSYVRNFANLGNKINKMQVGGIEVGSSFHFVVARGRKS
jgi:hypothetical protein